MRRLTLILSDLYLPEDARHAGGSTVHDLPALEWLLRVSDQPRRIADWRQWLLAQMPGPLGDIPLTAQCAHEFVPGEKLDTTWFATPVHLEARLDHVHLVDRGLLRLGAEERAAACEEFSRVLGAPYALYDGGERTLYLTGLAPVPVHTRDPARLLGSDIGPALPGREAGELRRLGAEIEMWLHGAAFNEARERARKPRVSTLWLWRGSAPEPHRRKKTSGIDAEFLGGDPLIGPLSHDRQRRARAVPSAFAQLDAKSPHVVAEFAPLCGEPHEELPALEANWFGPAMSALLDGTLAEVELVANDRVFRVAASARWRFWRRQSHWLARLGGDAGEAQA